MGTRVAEINPAMTFVLFSLIAPGMMITTEQLGRAMIRVARDGAPKHVLENRDLLALAV